MVDYLKSGKMPINYKKYMEELLMAGLGTVINAAVAWAGIA